MNWREFAVEKLERYRLVLQAQESTASELKQLELEAQGIRSPDFAAVRNVGGGADRMLNQLSYRMELEQNLERGKQWLRAVESALSVLGEREYSVLESAYIRPQYGNVTQLCEQLQMDRKAFYRLREHALENFTLAMYGCLES